MNYNRNLFPLIKIEEIKRWEYICLISVLWLVVVILFSIIPIEEQSTVLSYIKMAKNPYEYTPFPYGCRLFTPWIVHHLNLNIDSGFRYVAFVGFWLTGIFLYLLMRLVNTSPLLCFYLVGIFYLSPTVKYLTANPWYIDPLSYVFLCITLIGTVLKINSVTILGLVFGTINRPSSIVYSLATLVILWSNQSFQKNVSRSILILSPSIICLLLIIYAWPYLSDYGVLYERLGSNMYNNSSDFLNIYSKQGLLYLLSPQIYHELMPCMWGVILVGMTVSPKRLLLAGITVIALSILPMVATTDYFRLPFYSFPALFWFSALGFDRLYHLKSNVSYFWLAVCIAIMITAPKSFGVGCTVSALVLINYYFLSRIQK